MAKSNKPKRKMRWLHANIPVHHGLTIVEATQMANRLLAQQRREGYKAKLGKGGKLKFVKVGGSR